MRLYVGFESILCALLVGKRVVTVFYSLLSKIFGPSFSGQDFPVDHLGLVSEDLGCFSCVVDDQHWVSPELRWFHFVVFPVCATNY